MGARFPTALVLAPACGNSQGRLSAGGRSYSEVRAVGQIRHEHVVTIHDSGHTEDGRPYLAMEFLAGEDLASHLKQHGPMHSSRAMLLWRQAVSAVAAAHRRQVVHRDIKPANLFVTYKEGDDGPEEIIKVIDFSIAKLINPGREPRPTEPGAIVGTVLYMAPEQLESSEATPRSDVYSLGLVLMEMLTGRLPWGGAAGDPIEVGNALLRLVAAPASLRELEPEQPFSEELLQLARDVLSRDPSQRPADAGELLRRIKLLPEMREWQRLPRRLSWPAPASSELLPAGLTRQPAPSAATGLQLESADRTVPESPVARPLTPRGVPQLATADRVAPAAAVPPGDPAADDSTTEQTAPEGSRSKSSWSLGSSGVPEINDDWAEPTIPAGAGGADNPVRSLVASLVADSRQAQAERGKLPGGAPVAKLGAPPSRPPVAQPSSAKEDSNSNSSGNGVVWSAEELDRRLHAHENREPAPLPRPPESAPSGDPVADRPPAAPDIISEQPTVPTGHPMVFPISRQSPSAASPAAASSAASPAAAPSAITDKSSLPGQTTRPLATYMRLGRQFPWGRALAGVMALGAVVAIYVLGFRTRPAEVHDAPQPGASALASPEGAAGAALDLMVREAPRGVAPAVGLADLGTADKATPADLADARILDSADLGPAEVAGLLRVRFVYGDDEGISSLACEPQQGPARRSVAQHRVTVRVALLPGALCKVSGPELARSYSYEQIARSRPERSGEIRFHVRGIAPSKPDEGPAPGGSSEAPAGAPEPAQPATPDSPEGAAGPTAPAPKPPSSAPSPSAPPP